MYRCSVAYTDFNEQSTSVQQVLEPLRKNHVLSHQQKDEAVAKLMGWNYNPAYWNSCVAFAAAKLSN
jgi:hypothetical protein